MFRKISEKILLIALLISIFISYFHPLSGLYNQDLGMTLKLGQVIVTQGFVPKVNLLTYTYPNFSFVDTEALAQIIFYKINTLFGVNGLIILDTFLYLIAFLILIFYCYRKKENAATIGLAGVMGLVILSGRAGIRPEVFSYFFLSIFSVIVYSFKNKYTKWIYLLIPLEIVWVNTHIYFPLGPLMVWMLFFDQALSKKIFSQKKHFRQFFNDAKNKALIVTAITTSLVTLINPNGITGALYPLTFSSNYGIQVSENRSIFYNPFPYHRINIEFFLAWVFLLTVLQLMNKKGSLFDWLLTVIFSLGGIMITRLTGLIVFATFIPFVKSFNFASNSLADKVIKSQFVKRNLYIGLLFIVILLIWFTGKTIVQFYGYGLGFSDDLFTGNSIKFMQDNKLQGPLFNDYDSGSFLELWPYTQHDVFVDSRPDAFPTTFFTDDYYPMQQSIANFNKADAKYHFNTVFITYVNDEYATEHFLSLLVNDPSWKLVYLDDFIVIFVKNNINNKEVIQRYAITKNNVRIQNAATLDPNNLFQVNTFFNQVGWFQDEQNLDQIILKQVPTYCPALQDYLALNSQNVNQVNDLYIHNYSSYCE